MQGCYIHVDACNQAINKKFCWDFFEKMPLNAVKISDLRLGLAGLKLKFPCLKQLADIKSAGISGTPLDFVEFNSFNRTFTIVYIVKNK